MKSILTIAGSDSCAGAGIQGDIKTIASYGLHGLSAITAVTAQNTRRVRHIQPIQVEEQLLSIEEDFTLAAIKIGMLYTKHNMRQVIDWTKAQTCPIILDPVLCSSTGQQLIETDGIDLMKKLMRQVTLITPNCDEASLLLGEKIVTYEAMEKACNALYEMFGTSVLLKGGHFFLEDKAIDFFCDGKSVQTYTQDRLISTCTHGTGCCLSTAIACEMASGLALAEAIKNAKKKVYAAIRDGYKIGQGEGTVNILGI